MKLNLSKFFGNTVSMAVLLLILVILALTVPWLVITSLNSLFPVLAIPFNLQTWSAVWVLNAFARLTISTAS